MKKKIIKIASALLCFLLGVVLFLTTMFISVGGNINHRSINRYITMSGYSNILSEKVLEKFYQMADVNGLPHEIFDDFVDSAYMTNDIYEYVVSMSSGKADNKHILDISSKQSDLEDKIRNYVASNMELDSEQYKEIDKNISDFASECVSTYKNIIKSSVLQKIYKYTDSINRNFIWVSCVLIAICVALAAILVIIQEWKHRGLRYIVYSLVSCELTVILLVVYMNLNKIAERVAVTSKELYKLVSFMIKGCLGGFYIFIILLAILILIFSYFYSSSRKKSL